MGSLSIERSQVTFEDTRGERVLLDCTDLLANKSRVSMHRLLEQTHPTIPEILTELILGQQTEDDDFTVPFGTLDTLLTARLIRSAKPVRVLEYGSGRGELSVHLAKLLGMFHERSSLVCAYDTIELEWMERISHIEKLPVLSFLAADFGNSGLQKNSFDVVVLNGLADFINPYDVLKDAVSLMKTDGMLFCYNHDTPLLESVFKLFFETRDEYEINPTCKVMAAEASQCSWREAVDVSGLLAAVRKDLARAAEIDGSCEHGQCVRMLEQLQKDICVAVEQGETALKIQLLAEKERLLTSLIPGSEGYRR